MGQWANWTIGPNGPVANGPNPWMGSDGPMGQWAYWALGRMDQWDGPTGLILEEYAHQPEGVTLFLAEQSDHFGEQLTDRVTTERPL